MIKICDFIPSSMTMSQPNTPTQKILFKGRLDLAYHAIDDAQWHNLFQHHIDKHTISNISVFAQAMLQQGKLYLSYHVQYISNDSFTPSQIEYSNQWLSKHIQWQPLPNKKHDIHFSDYLWQDNCLECFIGHDQQKQYVEINASPGGDYAVYHFDDYRKPSTMPPRPLLTQQQPNPDIMTPATIQWHDHDMSLNFMGLYERIFSFNIDQLPTSYQHFNLINLCVILYCHHIPLYFAVQHDDPPDFHQKDLWLAV